MSVSRKLIGIALTLVILGLTQTGFAANNQTSARGWLLAMDDMKPKQPNSMGHPGSARQTQQMAQGRMMEDKQMGRGRMMMDDRKTPDSAPMQDQGKMGQQGDAGGMWTRTERMMQGQMGGMPGMGAANGTVDVTERMEGRIAFLKAELQITEKQMADWNVLADALRSGRHHLIEARKLAVLDDKTPSAERLERYERHLTERLEAVKSARAAFVRLYAVLDNAQKQTADAILVPLIATF